MVEYLVYVKNNDVMFLLEVCNEITKNTVWQLRRLGVKSIGMFITRNWWVLNQFDVSVVTNKLYDPEIEVDAKDRK